MQYIILRPKYVILLRFPETECFYRMFWNYVFQASGTHVAGEETSDATFMKVFTLQRAVFFEFAVSNNISGYV